MSDKDKTAETLSAMGYSVVNSGGVLMVAVSSDEYDSQTFMSKLKTVIKDIGYKASWGLTTKNNKGRAEKALAVDNEITAEEVF